MNDVTWHEACTEAGVPLGRYAHPQQILSAVNAIWQRRWEANEDAHFYAERERDER